MPGRILPLYALACMESDGPIYGYSIAQRVRDRTEGQWNPGPGTVYPALRSLVRRGLARHERRGRRRLYRITPRGRQLLRQIRAGLPERASAPDLTVLWSGVLGGPTNPATARLRRVDNALRSLLAYFARAPSEPARERARQRAAALLERAQRQLARGAVASHRRARSGARRRPSARRAARPPRNRSPPIGPRRARKR
ncbi:MAG TPA: PadR family transcriptional regulator [Thermoplasmata archaeon]|nr:PadR family transcriptional regulator [Thermoplasmata archaeon]